MELWEMGTFCERGIVFFSLSLVSFLLSSFEFNSRDWTKRIIQPLRSELKGRNGNKGNWSACVAHAQASEPYLESSICGSLLTLMVIIFLSFSLFVDFFLRCRTCLSIWLWCLIIIISLNKLIEAPVIIKGN